MEAKTARETVDNILSANGIKFSVKLVGETVKGNWKCDVWRISLNDFETDYFTGLGHRKGNIKNKESAFYRVKPQSPCAADVLYSLLMDSEAINQSFPNWCGEYGYDTDSIKAFSTYQKCCEIGANLSKILSRKVIAELREALQDY